MPGSNESITADWIAVDWGTSHLRLWAMSQDGRILDAKQSKKGMNQLQAHEYEQVLFALIDLWLAKQEQPTEPITVLICGMAGAKQGWLDAGYHSVPWKPVQGTILKEVPVSDKRIRCFIVPGLKQENPADVIRGEESQATGFLSLYPDYEGMLCLPGTHSKWLSISQGKVQSFNTFLTGELFALLSSQSVLRYAVASSENPNPINSEDKNFTNGVKQSLEQPLDFLSQLFSIRAHSILHDVAPESAYAYLSGLLIGGEIMASQNLWQDQSITLIGDKKLISLYAKAIALAGGSSDQASGSDMVVMGLYDLWQKNLKAGPL